MPFSKNKAGEKSMKKALSVSLIAVISAILCLLLVFAATATSVFAATSKATASDSVQVYLMPGSYYAQGEKVYNTVTGMTALTETERDALHLEGNVYKAGEKGDALPNAVTGQEGRTFNGWWYIKDALVTYTEVVPDVKATTYLYADFRADLSQPKDPVAPSGTNTDAENYMEIYRASTGKRERAALFVSGTDVPNAVGRETYGGPVQFYNEWFTLAPGDIMTCYISGVYGDISSGAMRAPQSRNGKLEVQLESNANVNHTVSWLEKQADSGSYSFRCKADAQHPYRIYIKFYDAGGTMTIYMEPQDKVK